MTVEATVRERVLAEHRGTVESVLACADGVANSTEFPAGRDVVVPVLEARLRDEGAFLRLVDLLRTAVDAAGYRFRAEPVPAPPYVVVTGRGPMVRATVDDGRLVVSVHVFRLADGGYVRSGADPDEVVEVEFDRR